MGRSRDWRAMVRDDASLVSSRLPRQPVKSVGVDTKLFAAGELHSPASIMQVEANAA